MISCRERGRRRSGTLVYNNGLYRVHELGPMAASVGSGERSRGLHQESAGKCVKELGVAHPSHGKGPSGLRDVLWRHLRRPTPLDLRRQRRGEHRALHLGGVRRQVRGCPCDVRDLAQAALAHPLHKGIDHVSLQQGVTAHSEVGVRPQQARHVPKGQEVLSCCAHQGLRKRGEELLLVAQLQHRRRTEQHHRVAWPHVGGLASGLGGNHLESVPVAALQRRKRPAEGRQVRRPEGLDLPQRLSDDGAHQRREGTAAGGGVREDDQRARHLRQLLRAEVLNSSQGQCGESENSIIFQPAN
mmetsp:Transcript_158397/g.508088  ORF Transcript_158397/g.508088 Transcript_158397/m.508088 type:complete len:300 (+) Transcript_158397:763-1662(+)